MKYDPDKPYPPGHFYLLPQGGLACNLKWKYRVYRADYNKELGVTSRVGPRAARVKALGYIPRDFFK